MNKKKKEEKEMPAIAKPISNTRIEFSSQQEVSEFVKWATNKQGTKSKMKSMYESYKKTKKER